MATKTAKKKTATKKKRTPSRRIITETPHRSQMSKKAIQGIRTFMAKRMGQGVPSAPEPDLGEVSKRPDAEGGSAPVDGWIECRQYGPRVVTQSQRKLMRVDPQINLALHAIQAPVLAAMRSAYVQSTDPAIEAYVMASFLPMLAKMSRTGLNALAFGFVGHEKIYEVKDVTTINSDGGSEPTTTVLPNRVVYKDLFDLDPERWKPYVDSDGQYVGLMRGRDAATKIKADKTWLMIHDAEFRSLTGNSMLDPIFEPWQWCAYMHMFTNRYYERRAVPSIIARAPKIVEDGEGGEMAGVEIMGDLLEGLSGGGILVLPWEVDAENGKQVWDAEIMAEDKRGEMFLSYIDYLQVMKLRGMVIPERVLTQSQGWGTFAMAMRHTETFEQTLTLILDELLHSINKFLIKPIVAMNFQNPAPVEIKTDTKIADRRDLIANMLTEVMQTEARDGVTDTASLVDKIRAFEQLNVPLRKDARRPAPGGRGKTALQDAEGVAAVRERQREKLADQQKSIAAGVSVGIPLAKELQKACYEHLSGSNGRSGLTSKMASAAAKQLNLELVEEFQAAG